MPSRGISGPLNSGSVTIEASVSMVIFTVAIVALLSVIQAARLQAHLGNALNRTALELSQYSYFYYLSGAYGVSQTIKTAGALPNDGDAGEMDSKQLLEYAQLFFGADEEADSEQQEWQTLFPLLSLSGLSGGLAEVQSHLVTEPIIRSVFLSQAVPVSSDADRLLRSRGVKDGLDGLDFGASVLFPPDAPDEIRLTLRYEILIPFSGGVIFPVVAHAVTGAWLGGDATAARLAASKNGAETSEIPSDGSLWRMSDFARGQLFKEIYAKSYADSDQVKEMQGVIGYDAATNTYFHCVSIDVFSASYNQGGFSASEACGNTLRKVKGTIKSVQQAQNGRQQTAAIRYTVIIPEDASDEVYAALLSYLDRKSFEQSSSDPRITITYHIVRAGGNAND